MFVIKHQNDHQFFISPKLYLTTEGLYSFQCGNEKQLSCSSVKQMLAMKIDLFDQYTFISVLLSSVDFKSGQQI